MVHHVKEKVFGSYIGVIFAFVLLIVSEFLVKKIAGVSFFSLIKSGSRTPMVVFVCGAIIGMAWEYVGQFGFNWWYYPAIIKQKWLLVTLPIFWAIFMVIMQDVYVIFRVIGFPSYQAVIISTLLLGFLIEGVNLYTHSWVYTGWRAHPVMLVLGWLVLLSSTFIVGFNLYITNIFGF